MKRLGLWLRTNSLWAAALGLMLASSGLDGAWLAKMMPTGLGGLGYILNTTSDLAGLILIYWFGVFRQSPKNTKRYKLALVLLPAEIVAVAYSWYFAYLQLMLVLPAVMQGNVQGVALVSAGFIPLMLAFIGWAQALLAGKWDMPAVSSSSKTSAAEGPASEPVKIAVPELGPAVLEPEMVTCKQCGKQFGTKQALNAHKRWCKGASK